MATGVSGSMSTNASTYIVAEVDYSETYDVASNTSSVTASLWYRRTNNWAGATVSPGTFYVTINGTDYAVYTGTFTIPGNDTQWKKVGEKTVTGIAHNADGSKSITIGGKHSTTATNVAYMNFSLSKTVTLTTIPRASKPSTNANSLTLNGSSLVINTNRASNSFTHTIKVQVGDQTATYNNVGASVTFTPTVSVWMPQMDSYEKKATVTCTTYNGSTLIGSAQTCTFTMKVDTSTYKPTVKVDEKRDTNETTLALESSESFIKGYSNLSLSITFGVNNSSYGSTFKSAKITAGSVSQSYNLSGTSKTVTFTLNAITVNTIKVEVTDNRGVIITQNVSLSLLDYSAVTISSVKCERVNSSGTPSETGDNIKYTIVCNVFRGSFGQANNILKLYSYSKQASASSYGSAVLERTVTPSGSGANASYTLTGIVSGKYSANSQHDIRFRVYDSLSNKYATAVRINEGVPVFAWGKDHFDVYGALHVHDRGVVSDYVEMSVASLNKLINSDTASLSTKVVTFNGASGGSVTWTIFKFGSFRIAVCKWRAASNATINSTWAGFYYSNDFGTPNFPFTFNDVLFLKTEYVAGDTAAHADCWNSGRSGSISKTTAGSVYLVRPNDGGPVTIGHPVFTEIVIGTV